MAHDFLQSNSGQVVTKFDFNSLFAKAWIAVITPIKTCGIYPFDHSAIGKESALASGGNCNETLPTSTTDVDVMETCSIPDGTVEDIAGHLPLQFTAQQKADDLKRGMSI